MYVLTLLFVLALLFFLLRGPYLSNSIKRLIQPVLEKAIGEKVIIDKAVINPFPFYIQTKGFKVFDKDGNRLLWVTRMRAHIDILSLFSREIRIRRLALLEPSLSIDRSALVRIIENVNGRGPGGEGKRFRVNIMSVKINNGEFILTDRERQAVATGRRFDAEMTARNEINITTSLRDGGLRLHDLPVITAGISGSLRLSDRKIQILDAKLSSVGSTLEAGGEMQLSPAGAVDKGSFTGKASVLIETIGQMFGLKENRQGTLSFSGSVDMVSHEEGKDRPKTPDIKIDLRTKGWFYLETLMELLKVKEHILGRVSIDGAINGIYPDVTGKGKLTLEGAFFDTLSIDKAEGEVTYENNKFVLNDFIAKTYGGEMSGDASLAIPSGGYSVDGRAQNINSRQFFKFIKWEPPFPEGRIDGDFMLAKVPGRKIAVSAQTVYLNTSVEKGGQFNDRFREARAELDMRDGVIKFDRAALFTADSEIILDGSVDLINKNLDLKLDVNSRDASDFSAPYFAGLKSPLRFAGTARGSSINPEISGHLAAGPGLINGQPFKDITGELKYTPRLLSISSLKIRNGESIYEAPGSIAFRGSEGLFSFRDPYYKATGEIKNGDAKELLAAVYPSEKIPVNGTLKGKISFDGDTQNFKGAADIGLENAEAYGQVIDRAAINAALSPEALKFPRVTLHREKSSLESRGELYFDKKFNAVITSGSVHTRDIAFLNKYPVDANSARGEFMERAVTAEANITFTRAMPWDLQLKFKRGRYDFLLAGLIKDVPRDLSASLEGFVDLKGNRNKYSMNSRFSSLDVSLYGYNFRNKEDIVLEFMDDVFTVKALTLKGLNGDMTVEGDVKVGQSYNLKTHGDINLAPLKILTRDIESLRGDGSFDVDVSGNWNSPELRGKINIRDTNVKLEGVPYRIGPLGGDIFLDKERVTIDSFNVDYGGGKIFVSGAGRMDGLSLKALFLSSEIKDIRFRPMEGVDATLDGKLFFEMSPKKQSLAGDINIKRARYEKRI
ncbi:MAG: translocation/assembly module TamB domain-containing protein, partial [Nitrospirae bacterium]|nr:translocation/assembly module TamB domain-containing protein [Nitrospirota bacterium]